MRKSSKSKRDEAPVERVTYTVPQAGKRLGIGKNAAYEAARTGQIPTIRIGRRIVVPIAAFEKMLELGT